MVNAEAEICPCNSSLRLLAVQPMVLSLQAVRSRL